MFAASSDNLISVNMPSNLCVNWNPLIQKSAGESRKEMNDVHFLLQPPDHLLLRVPTYTLPTEQPPRQMILVIPLKLVFIRQKPENAYRLFLGLFHLFLGHALSCAGYTYALCALALFQGFVNVEGKELGCAGMGVDDGLEGGVDGGLKGEGGGEGGGEDEGVFVKEEEDGVDPLEGEGQRRGRFRIGRVGIDVCRACVDGFPPEVDIGRDGVFQCGDALVSGHLAKELV